MVGHPQDRIKDHLVDRKGIYLVHLTRGCLVLPDLGDHVEGPKGLPGVYIKDHRM